MVDVDRKACRYFLRPGGCWYGDRCNFRHISEKIPDIPHTMEPKLCKFVGTPSGCRFGENCYFSHDTQAFDNADNPKDNLCFSPEQQEESKETMASGEVVGTNNNKCTREDSLINKYGNKEIKCGSCSFIVEPLGEESFDNLMKKHYLDCFLEKDHEHIKCVHLFSSQSGQLYWCKTCYLVFDKLWSLFQHVVDKVQNIRTQKWDKRMHMEWLDAVATSMAGFDLGLFTPLKMRLDLRYLFTEQNNSPDEEKAMANSSMPWLNPSMLPWRMQQRQMMRKIETLNRHISRRGLGGQRGGMAPGGPKSSRGRPYRLNMNHENENATTGPSQAPQGSGDSNNLDYNCGFSDEEVKELYAQGINPWDEEAHLALKVLRGELDYLLQDTIK